MAVAIGVLFLAAPILAILPSARSDPVPGTNIDMTRTFTWDYDSSSDYTTTNTTVSGGFGTLSFVNETALENTRAGYAQGTRQGNITIDAIADSIVLNQSAQTVTRVSIQPGPTDGKDAYLLQNWPDQNYGDQTSMMIESLNTKNDRPIMRFNLSAIPSGAVVQDAVLFIDFLKNNRPNPVTFSVQALSMDWVEMEATWSHASLTQTWTGGAYNPAIFYRGTTSGAQGWYQMDVSRLVDLWLKGTLTNYGLIMVPDNGDNTASWKYFYASNEPTPDLRPKLVVNYTIPGLAGSYESSALGPGTNSTFTLASWWNTTYSSVTDEFGGTSISPKWSWLNRPPANVSYDVGLTRPGWLYIQGEGNKQMVNTTIGANYLYQNVTGPFRSETLVNATFTTDTQGAGILLEDSPFDWTSLSMTGMGANTKLSWLVTEQGITTEPSVVPWTGRTDAHLRIDRAVGSVSAHYSDDGVTWTDLGTYTTLLPLKERLRVGLCVFSGMNPTKPIATFDYLRVTPPTDPTKLNVYARLGNSSALTDPSWEAWGAPLPSMSGSMLGRAAKYIQYEVTLTTVQDWCSPRFSGFECHHERFAPDGDIVTSDLAVSHLKRWLTITTTEMLLGETINYSYSVNHGATWTPLFAGSNSILDASPFMMIKASIHSNDTSHSPAVDRIVAQYAVAPSSFYMVTPATVLAGDPFSISLESKDEFNATISHWTGNVDLEAMDATGLNPATSTLSVTSAWISVGGGVVVGNEVYTAAETIMIKASADEVSSLSEPIMVIHRPISLITLEPNITAMLEFTSQTFSARAFDDLGNEIANPVFSWSAEAALGVINSTTGGSVLLTVGEHLTGGYLNVTAGNITLSRHIDVTMLLLPPVISPGMPDQVMPEDYGEWTLDISSFVSDKEDSDAMLRWYTTHETVVKIRGENRTGNMVITFDTIQDEFGINVLNLVVVDSDGMTASAPLYVEITPVNDAPTIDTIDPLVIHVGAAYIYNFLYYVHDVDNSTSELSLSVDFASKDFCLIDRLTISFEYGPAYLDTTQTVVVTVTDHLLSSSTAVIIRITNDGMPTIIASLHDLSLYQGESHPYEYDLSQVFRDPDKGDVLYYVTGNNHVTVDILDNGSVNITAPSDWYGKEYVVFQAIDPMGARVEIAVSITVIQVEKPPVLSPIPDLVVHYDQRYDFDLTPYIHDPDEPIDQLDLTLDDLHGYFIGPVLSLLYPFSMNGRTVTVNITVSDRAFQMTRMIHVTISDDSPPVVNPSIPDHMFQEDLEVAYPMGGGLEDYFLDTDGIVTYYTAFSPDPNVNATARLDTAELKWEVLFDVVENYNGITEFTIRATDNLGAIVEHTCALDIIPVPDAPELNITDHVLVKETLQFVLSIAGGITDPDSSMENGDFTFQVRLPEDGTGGKEAYLSYIKVLPGMLVFDFPKGFVQSGKQTAFDIEVRVIDQDGKVGSSVLSVTVEKVATKDNSLLQIGLLMIGALASGLFIVAVKMRKKPFVIKDMMLIHNDGFLIGRYIPHSHVQGEIDQDILSGMLTAVLNFVEDSMVTSQDQLKTFGFKEFQVLVKRGYKCFAAIVFEGDLPDNIDKPLNEFMGTFERVYKKKVANWTGDIETDFAGVEVLIQGFVKEHSKRSSGKTKKLWVSKKTESGGATAK